MDTPTSVEPVAPRTRKPSKRSNRTPYKLQADAVLAAKKAGCTTREIAAAQGVAHSTVTRFLEKYSPAIQAVTEFKNNRADILARIQLKALDLQECIIEDLAKDGLATTLTPQQKSGLLQSLNIVNGTLFDKERLERGQSTQNISTLSRMIDHSVTTAHQRRDAVTQPVVDNAPIIAVDSEVIESKEKDKA